MLECGLTMEQVMELGERDITPEDFELLSRLDEQPSIIKPGLLSGRKIEAIVRSCRVRLSAGGGAAKVRCFCGAAAAAAAKRRGRCEDRPETEDHGSGKGGGEEQEVELPSCSEWPECSVCLDELTADDETLLLPCQHFFHCACLRTWLEKYGNKCPMCHTGISPPAE